MVGEFGDGHFDGGEGSGAGGVYHAVHAAQVESIGHPTGNDVAQHAGKGVFFPMDVRFFHLLDDGGAVGFGNATAFQHAIPNGVLQTGGERGDELLPAAHAQHNARLTTVKVHVFAVSGIVHGRFGHDEGEQLRGVGDFQDVGRQAKFHGIEIDLWQKTAPFTVGFVRGGGVWVVVLLYFPTRGWDFGDAVHFFDDVIPIFLYVLCLWENTGQANDGNRCFA